MPKKRLKDRVEEWKVTQGKKQAAPTKPRRSRHAIREALFHTKRKRGRPTNQEIQRLGKEAAKLRGKDLTYGQIARRVCPRRSEHGHRCGKNCADRIRQAAKRYLT